MQYKLGIEIHITNATDVMVEVVRSKISYMVSCTFKDTCEVILRSAEQDWKCPEDTTCVFLIKSDVKISVAEFTHLFKNLHWTYSFMGDLHNGVWSRFARNGPPFLDEHVSWVHVYDTDVPE